MACAWPLRLVRVIAKPVLLLTGAAILLLLFHQFVLPLVSYVVPSLQPSFYDFGVFGLYPTVEYASFDLQPPRPLLVRWDPRCESGLVLLTPNGPSVSHPGPMILDSRGSLVWMTDEFDVAANLKVQRYRGQNYLTFWAGEKAQTSGKGDYYMLDSAYERVRVISAAGEDLYGDLHEFTITSNDTGLLTVYNATTADLSAMGRPSEGWVSDSVFQEINIETGELLFEWRASEHFDPNESYMTNPFAGYSAEIPFDFFHINSIDKDSAGNYIVSSRHFHSITCISPSGETLWVLGGRHNEFNDMSNGKATDFKWQHSAKWLSPEEGILVLFDNGKGGTLHVDAAHSRGLILQLNVEDRTVQVLETYVSQQGILSASQGSLQILPESDQAFVGWGSAAAYSEFLRDGTLICETHLGASWFYWWERMKSYRTMKALTWHGVPSTPPQAVLEGDEIYVSWNGATDVAFWALEVSHSRPNIEESDESSPESEGNLSNDDFFSIDIIPKVGFEGVFTLSSEMKSSEQPFSRYRVAALDANQDPISHSSPVIAARSGHGFLSMLFFAIFALAGSSALVGSILGTRSFMKRQNSPSRPVSRWMPRTRLNWRFPQWPTKSRYQSLSTDET